MQSLVRSSVSTNQETLLMSCNDNRETHILYMTLTKREILRKDVLSEMILKKEYSFVIYSEEKRLSPTPANNAWFLIRKGKAKLVSKYPMTIQLLRSIEKEDIDKSDILCGIDDGSKHVGLYLVQRCKN